MFCFQRAVPAAQCSRLQAPSLRQRDGSEFCCCPPGVPLVTVAAGTAAWQCARSPARTGGDAQHSLAGLPVASPGVNRGPREYIRHVRFAPLDAFALWQRFSPDGQGGHFSVRRSQRQVGAKPPRGLRWHAGEQKQRRVCNPRAFSSLSQQVHGFLRCGFFSFLRAKKGIFTSPGTMDIFVQGGKRRFLSTLK